MILKMATNFVKGYIRIRVEGYFIERFINICKIKGIYLWNIKRENSSIMHANIGTKEFRKLRKIVLKTKCKVRIEGKRGVPFLLHKYKKRKIFAFLLVAIVLGIITMSNFIWNIEICGTEKIDKGELLQTIKENGLDIGKSKSKIDTKKIINDVRLNRSDLAWIGIKIKGTNAIVEVVEAEEKPDIIKEDEYCNIVAKKDARIIKVDAANGTAVVNPGDIVRQGSVLIGGWMEGKYTGTRYVHSSGEVIAKTWYTSKQRVDLVQMVEDKTGAEEKKYRLNLHNFEINLYKKLSNFENYDTIYENKNIKIFSDFYLPVGITVCHNFETIEKQIEYSQEEAKKQAIEKAEAELLQEIGDKEIVDKSINVSVQNGYIEAEVTYEIIENIETKEKIVF